MVEHLFCKQEGAERCPDAVGRRHELKRRWPISVLYAEAFS